MCNECDSLISWNKIILDGIDMSLKSINHYLTNCPKYQKCIEYIKNIYGCIFGWSFLSTNPEKLLKVKFELVKA